MKDTCFLCVGHRSCAADCHVAVEGHLQGVAIGSVVEEATEESPASAGLHHVPVEGRVGLQGHMRTTGSETGRDADAETTQSHGRDVVCQVSNIMIKQLLTVYYLFFIHFFV